MKWWLCLLLSLGNVALGLELYSKTKVEAAFVLVGISAVLAIVSAWRLRQCP